MTDRTSEIDSIADDFFGGSANGDWDLVIKVVDEDATVWQNTESSSHRFHDMIPTLEKMRKKLGSWTYEDVRRLIGPESFCEQHTVRFSTPDERTVRIQACVVVQIGPSGKITRIEEYLDSAEAAMLAPSRR